MATASVPQYNPNRSQLYSYGVSQAAIDSATLGQYLWSGTTGDRVCMAVDAMTPLVNGSDVEITFSSLQCFVQSGATVNSVKLVIIRCPTGKVPSDADSGWTYVTTIETLVDPITASATVTAEELSQSFTWDTAYNYYMGWSARGTSVTAKGFGPQRCLTATGAFSQHYKWEVAAASLVNGLPAAGTQAVAGSAYALLGKIKIRTKARSFCYFADASAVSRNLRLYTPDYEADAGDDYNEYPCIVIKGAKTGDTVALKYLFKTVPADESAMTVAATFSLTAGGEANACVFGSGDGLSVDIASDAAAADLFNVVLSFNPRNAACDAFVDNQTGRGLALSTSDPQCFCHGEESEDAGNTPYGHMLVVAEIGDAGHLVITGGTGSQTGSISIGHEPLLTTGDSQFADSDMQEKLPAAFTRPRVLIPAAVSSSWLTADVAESRTAGVTRFLRGWQHLRGAVMLLGSGFYNDWSGGTINTPTKAQALIARKLAAHAQMLEAATMLDADYTRYNEVILVTSFFGAGLSVGTNMATYFPAYCELLMKLAEQYRCTGIDLYALVHPHDDWLSDHVHPSSGGAGYISAAIAEAYEGGLVPSSSDEVSGSRFDRGGSRF